jgi:hypothetical protein
METVVEPESGEQNGTVPFSSPAELPDGSLPSSPLSVELFPLKAAHERWPLSSTWMPRSAIYWALWTIPFVVIGGRAAWMAFQRRRQERAIAGRFDAAAPEAFLAIREARRLVYGSGSAGRILHHYLAVRLDRSVEGLTHRQIAQALADAGVPSSVAGRVEQCLRGAETGRYAPPVVRQEGAELLDETEVLIVDLEKTFSRARPQSEETGS